MIFGSTSEYMLKYQKAKSKLVEYDVKHEDYPRFNRDSNILVYSTIYILSKYAEGILTDDENVKSDFAPLLISAAQYFDAAEGSKDRIVHTSDFLLSGASAYFFISDFGSAKVLNSKLDIQKVKVGTPEYLLKLIFDYLLERKKTKISKQTLSGKVYLSILDSFSVFPAEEKVMQLLSDYRKVIYADDDPYEIYCVDLLCAVINIAFQNSSWFLLPKHSDINLEKWLPYLRSNNAINILWPSQQLICSSGILKGKSAIVQLPTGVGKTKSIELIIRAAFLSGRARTALIVAPLRALCNEITADMLKAFKASVNINQFSDILQDDIEQFFLEKAGKYVYICTPEKLSFIMHHQPEIVHNIELFILDEGHMFDDGFRGAMYEFLVSELKGTLNEKQQIVLLSAVLSNAEQIREWMLGVNGVLASNPSIKSTVKSIGFTSSTRDIHYYSDGFNEEDYYIPKSIVITELKKKKRERKPRFFPDIENAKDIALYYAIRLCHNGGVAIYVNRVSYVSTVINTILDLHEREFDFSAIQNQSNQAELKRLQKLFALYYGEGHAFSIACTLGVLPHFANLPSGLKISVEEAFRKDLVRVVVCTSTLAQGINIPIRYLLITDNQDRYSTAKIRDFQNLIGRTARSGMYTEGSIIITTPKLYDERRNYQGGRYRWDEFVQKLDPYSAEPCSSSVLEAIKDFPIDYQYKCEHVFEVMLRNIDTDDFVSHVENELTEQFFSTHLELSERKRIEVVSIIHRETLLRKSIIDAIENHICFICSETQNNNIAEVAEMLCINTLAFFLANKTEKKKLKEFFLSIAGYLSRFKDVSIIQLSKCAIGIDVAKKIVLWLSEKELTEHVYSEDDLLNMIVQLFAETYPSKHLPSHFIEVCRSWINGGNFINIFDITAEEQFSQAERLCGQTISYDLNFFIGNVSDLIQVEENAVFDPLPTLQLLQRKIKYGVPSKTAASICEKVFNDQQLSISISNIIGDNEIDTDSIIGAVHNKIEEVLDFLAPFPIYFTDRVRFLIENM